MKLNKILSSSLVLVMLLTLIIGVIPTTAFAAEDGVEISIKDTDLIEDVDQIKKICQDYLAYNFSEASEMLAHELELGYLDYIRDGDFAVYVNRYTGFMYYVNSRTGQILTSNPTDPAYQTKEGGTTVSLSNEIMGQLMIEYFALTDTKPYTYDSLRWIMDGSLLSVSEYEGGIAVQYTLGSAADSFIAPSVLTLDTANTYLIHPIFANFAAMMQEMCGDFDQALADSARCSSIKSGNYNLLENDIYRANSDSVYSSYKVNPLLDDYVKYAQKYFGSKSDENYKKIANYVAAIQSIFNNYDIIPASAASDTLKEKVSVLNDGQTILLLRGADTGDTTLAVSRQVEKAIKLTCPTYTLEMVNEHEAECGFATSSVSVPCFKITLVYTLDDGELVVSLPANLIEYDELTYSIKTITPLKYFGAGDMDEEGYVFYPDGSGSILEFEDFYYGSNSESSNTTVYIEAPVYGSDYCYSAITGAHREQIVMPVYGIVSDEVAGSFGAAQNMISVTNGYFAVMEQGASLVTLVTLGCESGGGMHKYISVFTEFAPFPSDTYDLSQSISVSGLGSYTVVSSASYTESLKIRYTMLVDEEIMSSTDMASADWNAYPASYVGMASCYRQYLEDEGVIDLLEESYSTLPLYIEALGSVDTTEKVLSFPVTVSKPLTTFSEVARMYSELSNAKQTLLDKADELEAEADELEKENATKHLNTIIRNRALAEEYRKLSENISNVNNINFRLTGFTNGGMHSTYPAKVKWEKSVGGSAGYAELLDVANGVNSQQGTTFGIYPDFDFLYINNVSAFDGISNNISSCMVDNRYASKQSYNSVNQRFESMFALVVSTGSLETLYSKFIKDYSKQPSTGVSVSTLGSDLNSDFDSDSPVVRETSIAHINSLLSQMSESYSVMTDKGNAYTWKYVDHILGASLDSSHLNNSSYAIPFYGMVLHGYVNYAGTPINYSGSPEYELLRSIESGASLYYILCTENTNYLKEDKLLSQYYGVDYENWFTKIVEHQTILNDAIGDLQQHRLASHSILLCERVINERDADINTKKLIEEFLGYVDKAISTKIDRKIKEMREEGMLGVGLCFTISDEEFASLILEAADRTNLPEDVLCEKYELDRQLTELIDGYRAEYKDGGEQVSISSADISYKSRYKYVTDSMATDKNYVATDYTCDNGNVVMVSYEREIDGEIDRVVFLLNYNLFSVKIRIDESIHEAFADYCDEDGYITLDSFGYVKIQG